MRFSQRINQKPINKVLQLTSVDDDLRNSLWNIVLEFVIDDALPINGSRKPNRHLFSREIWMFFYKLPIDEIPVTLDSLRRHIKTKYFSYAWDDMYDFLEFIAERDYNFYYSNNQLAENFNINRYIKRTNEILEIENSAYRFSAKKLIPISNDSELDEVEEAISQGSVHSTLDGVTIHFTSAVEKLSDRKNPDYRNSIKESISAVETLCRTLTNESTLGKALNAFQNKGFIINAQLKDGIEKIYAYTNSKESGIRHSIMDAPVEPDFDDAKYMLVSCSAFVNYLIGKCIKLGISIS